MGNMIWIYRENFLHQCHRFLAVAWEKRLRQVVFEFDVVFVFAEAIVELPGGKPGRHIFRARASLKRDSHRGLSGNFWMTLLKVIVEHLLRFHAIEELDLANGENIAGVFGFIVDSRKVVHQPFRLKLLAQLQQDLPLKVAPLHGGTDVIGKFQSFQGVFELSAIDQGLDQQDFGFLVKQAEVPHSLQAFRRLRRIRATVVEFLDVSQRIVLCGFFCVLWGNSGFLPKDCLQAFALILELDHQDPSGSSWANSVPETGSKRAAIRIRRADGRSSVGKDGPDSSWC